MSLIAPDLKVRGLADSSSPIAGTALAGIAPVIPGRWICAALVGSAVAVAGMMKHATLMPYLEPRLVVVAALYLAGTAAALIGLRGSTARLGRAVRDIAEYFGLFAAICLLGAIASYPVAAMSTGYSDWWLARTDRALGFAWIDWYRFAAAHPLIELAARAAYQSIYLSPALILGHAAWNGRRGEAIRFLAGFWLAAIITLAAFAAIPSQGPLAIDWTGPLPYVPASALYQAELIPLLRAHTLHWVDIGALRGLVGAPSFHAASAVLYIAAAWRAGALRWPLITLNLAMLLATPVEGTHYLIDILMGAAVAVLAALLARTIAARIGEIRTPRSA